MDITGRKGLLKPSNLLLKLFLAFVGFTLIFLFVVRFNTFSLTTGIKDLNNFYWIVFFIFLLFSFLIPVLIVISVIDMNSLNEKKLQKSKNYVTLWETYDKTFLGRDKSLCPEGMENKTRANADLYFSLEEIVSSKFLKLPILAFFKNISGTFVGLGILGTFMGFAQFLNNIIEGELNFESVLIFEGLKVAFNTSIIGLFASIIYRLFIYYPINGLAKATNTELCDAIDEEHYVSDERCMRSLSQIIEKTEISIASNFEKMCIDIGNVISAERESFTKQVLFATEQLAHIDNSLENIPVNVKLMSDELNKSIELAKEKTKEMSNECIANINKELENVFGRFANRFDDASTKIESATTEIEKIPDNFKDAINDILIPVKENFKSLEKGINKNLSNICVSTVNEVKRLFEEERNGLSEFNNKLSSTAETCLKDVEKRMVHFIEETKQSTFSTYKMLGKTISDSCAEFTQNVSESVSTLEVFSAKTGEFTNEYKLLQETLSGMTDKIRESQENVVNGTDEIKNVLSEFNKTSLLMENTQKIYNDLADSLKFLPLQHKKMQEIYQEGANVLRDALVVSIEDILKKVNNSEIIKGTSV